jgi:hypothetical protein
MKSRKGTFRNIALVKLNPDSNTVLSPCRALNHLEFLPREGR